MGNRDFLHLLAKTWGPTYYTEAQVGMHPSAGWLTGTGHDGPRESLVLHVRIWNNPCFIQRYLGNPQHPVPPFWILQLHVPPLEAQASMGPSVESQGTRNFPGPTALHLCAKHRSHTGFPCLWRSAPGYPKAHLHEHRNPNFPSTHRHPEIPQGTSLISRESWGDALWAWGDWICIGIPMVCKISCRSTSLGPAERSSGVPVLSHHKANRCPQQ